MAIFEKTFEDSLRDINAAITNLNYTFSSAGQINILKNITMGNEQTADPLNDDFNWFNGDGPDSGWRVPKNTLPFSFVLGVGRVALISTSTNIFTSAGGSIYVGQELLGPSGQVIAPSFSASAKQMSTSEIARPIENVQMFTNLEPGTWSISIRVRALANPSGFARVNRRSIFVEVF